MGKAYPDEVKELVVRAAEHRSDWQLVAAHNDAAGGAASGWVTSARKTGDDTVSPDLRGGAQHQKIKDEHIEYPVGELAANCELTLAQVKTKLAERFQMTVLVETARHALDAVDCTVKKLHLDTEYRNTTTNKLKRRQFAIELLGNMPEQKKIGYLDETNCNLSCSRSCIWSCAGTRAVQKNVASKGKNIYVIACISVVRLEYSKSRFGSFHSAAAKGFTRRMLRAIGARQ